MGKGILWEDKMVSLEKTNGFLKEEIRNKKVCDNVCLCRCVPPIPLARDQGSQQWWLDLVMGTHLAVRNSWKCLCSGSGQFQTHTD